MSTGRQSGGSAGGAGPGAGDRRTGTDRTVTAKSYPTTAVAANPVLEMQRRVGNRAACELLKVGQAKLDVGAANDRYEQEADGVAREVVNALASAGAASSAGGSSAGGNSGVSSSSSGHGPHPGHEACGAGVEELGGGQLARKVTEMPRRAEVGAEGGTVGEETERAISSARGGGAALDGKTRRAMEGAFGADFSAVRVHTGPESSALNERVQAKAFTIGSDIFFRDGVPDGTTAEGQALLAHELTHTIQQGGSKLGRKRS